LWDPLAINLAELINTSPALPAKIREYYLHGKQLRPDLLICSGLREAPALGAGIDAFLTYKKDNQDPI
jgi:hypothetical protein